MTLLGLRHFHGFGPPLWHCEGASHLRELSSLYADERIVKVLRTFASSHRSMLMSAL
jgi:hypothetical protein